VGCSQSSLDEEFDEQPIQNGTEVLQKWFVDVHSSGCEGLFYRRVPGEIVAGAN
jgi:hypothetical protein